MANYPHFDVVVVGSGPAGVHAAYPLVKAGLHIAIVDAGLDGKKIENALATKHKSNPHDLLAKSGYVFNKTYELLKVKSNTDIIQSLAKGGLSEIWHGVCDFFTPQELETIGLPKDEIQKEYQEIARRINLKLRPLLDLHGKFILKKAKNKVYRLPVVYSYRTSSVVEELKKHKNFTYIPNQLVVNVQDKNKYVEMENISIEGKERIFIRSRYLILAAGALNTTRILLRSFKLYSHKVPFLTKGHIMFVCLHPRTLIKQSKNNNFGQVSLVCNKVKNGLNSFFVQFYRCNPQSKNLALQYIPLPKQLASLLFSIIAPYLVIVDIRFPTFESNKSFCRLKNTKQEILEISSPKITNVIKKHKKELEIISKEIRALGLIPLKTITSDVTSHYGGGVPFSPKPNKLSTDFNGKLHQTKRIYIADSSTWKALPAKPPTLTIMANASRVGKTVLNKF